MLVAAFGEAAFLCLLLNCRKFALRWGVLSRTGAAGRAARCSEGLSTELPWGSARQRDSAPRYVGVLRDGRSG